MSFNDISYLELWQPFCSVEQNHLCNWWGRESWLLCLICLPGVSWWFSGSSSRCHGLSAVCDCGISWSYSLTIFGRRHHEEQFCEIILNLGQWFRRRCHLNIFLIWSCGGPFVQQSGTICAILVEGIMRNNSVNLFRIWANDSGDIV